MFYVFTDCRRFFCLGLFSSTTQFIHCSWYLDRLLFFLIIVLLTKVATKGVVVSDELETSKQSVDLGRCVISCFERSELTMVVQRPPFGVLNATAR